MLPCTGLADVLGRRPCSRYVWLGQGCLFLVLCIRSLQGKYLPSRAEWSADCSGRRVCSVCFCYKNRPNSSRGSLFSSAAVEQEQSYQGAHDCFGRISLGFSIRFPTFCVSPGPYMCCGFYLFFFKHRAVCLTLQASCCAAPGVQQRGGVFWYMAF